MNFKFCGDGERVKGKGKAIPLQALTGNLLYIINPYRAVNTFHHGYKSALYKQSVRTAL
jgi:hypothetical protein